jgi:hypothetical protein
VKTPVRVRYRGGQVRLSPWLALKGKERHPFKLG